MMRTYSWIALGAVAFACSGSAFTANDETAGGADGDAGSSPGGELGSGGRVSSGGKVGSGGSGTGGKVANGGNTGVAGAVSSGGLTGLGGDLGIGGDLVVGGTFTVAGTTSTGGTGSPPVDKFCPKLMPTAGGLCADGLECSYTADVRTACRPIAKCDNGKWAIDKPECEVLHGCPTLKVGDQCDAASAIPCMLNATDGIYCVCTGCGNGGPCSDETLWACAAGSGGSSCPKLPPNEGQMCAGDAACGYGSCATDNGVNAVCKEGTWNWDSVACPL